MDYPVHVLDDGALAREMLYIFADFRVMLVIKNHLKSVTMDITQNYFCLGLMKIISSVIGLG